MVWNDSSRACNLRSDRAYRIHDRRVESMVTLMTVKYIKFFVLWIIRKSGAGYYFDRDGLTRNRVMCQCVIGPLTRCLRVVPFYQVSPGGMRTIVFSTKNEGE